MSGPNQPHDYRAAGISPTAQAHDNNPFLCLEARAEACPDEIAIVYHGRQLTYRALLDASRTLAGYLQQHLGVRRGDRVLLLMHECPQLAIARHAVLCCDAVIVAISALSTAEEVARHVADSNASAVVTMQDGLSRVTPLLSGHGLRGCVVGAYSEFAGEPGTPAWQAAPEYVRDPRVPILQPRVHEFAGALAAGIAPAPMQRGGLPERAARRQGATLNF